MLYILPPLRNKLSRSEHWPTHPTRVPLSDRLITRPYTPTASILEREEDRTFDLVVKTYFPGESQPGGMMSNILDCLRPGEEIEVKRPSGEIRYVEQGKFLSTIGN